MKKKVLVLGTSHSYGFCLRDTAENKMTEGRWHDYFKTEYDMEVTNLSQPGVTPSGMLAGLLYYLSENPNERWDIAIVEGRHIEQHFDVLVRHDPRYIPRPMESEKQYLENLPGWRFSGGLGTDQFLPDRAYGIHKFMTRYFTQFMGSPLQAIQTYGLNRSICSLLETVSNKVMWTSWTSWTSILDEETKKWVNQLLGEWIAFGEPTNKSEDMFLEEKKEYMCKCGHFNEKGHEWIWRTMYKPVIEKLLIEEDK